MNDWVEIGIFAAAEPSEVLGDLIYLRRHRIRSGGQTITVTVPRKPARGGIDPYNLLDWEQGADDDNIERVEVES